MDIDKAMTLLKESFNKEFRYEYEYNIESFNAHFKLFADDVLIGNISSPQDTYTDILYTYGALGIDDFHTTIYSKLPSIPEGFKSVEEFAEAEVKDLLLWTVGGMLERLPS